MRALGTGGAGAVYLAIDRESGEQLALKKLLSVDKKSVSRFKREFRALANFHHPNTRIGCTCSRSTPGSARTPRR